MRKSILTSFILFLSLCAFAQPKQTKYEDTFIWEVYKKDGQFVASPHTFKIKVEGNKVTLTDGKKVILTEDGFLDQQDGFTWVIKTKSCFISLTPSKSEYNHAESALITFKNEVKMYTKVIQPK